MRFSLTAFAFALLSATAVLATPTEGDGPARLAVNTKDAAMSTKKPNFTGKNVDDVKSAASGDLATFQKRSEPDSSSSNDEDEWDDGDEEDNGEEA